jgi:hypothetical protein
LKAKSSSCLLLYDWFCELAWIAKSDGLRSRARVRVKFLPWNSAENLYVCGQWLSAWATNPKLFHLHLDHFEAGSHWPSKSNDKKQQFHFLVWNGRLSEELEF